MTITDPSRLEATEGEGFDFEAEAPMPDEAAIEPWWRRVDCRLVGVVAVGIVAIFTLIVVSFENPIAEQWYRTRQRHLVSNLAVKQSGIATGQAVGILQIPRLGTNVAVVEGDRPADLRNGPGHRVATPVPGRKGNSVIMGHRAGWGGPFANLARVRRGDFVVVQDRAGQNIVFTVATIQHLGTADRRPFARSTDHRVTLVTSDGGLRSNDRLVVTAVSGTRGRLARPSAADVSATAGESWFINGYTVLAVLSIVGAGGAYLFLRRRHHIVALVVIMTPLVSLSVLCVLLNLDLRFLPPLR